jgi:hypothetical protein
MEDLNKKPVESYEGKNSIYWVYCTKSSFIIERTAEAPLNK